MKSTGVRVWDVLRLRWRSLLRRSRMEDELDEELRFHFENVVGGYIRNGMTPEAARRRARLEHGGAAQIKEECRDARRVAVFENVFRDVALAWRGFLKNPGFALTAAATIAVGVGANTALFSLVYGLLLRPLPVRDPHTIRNVHVGTTGDGRRSQYGTPSNVSFVEFAYMRQHAKTAELAGIAETGLSRKGDSRPVHAQLVSDNLLPMIGGRPALGRFFLPEEVRKPGGEPVTVLSHVAWRDWFGASTDVIGKTIVLNRKPFTIVGVADETTTGPLLLLPAVWIPLTMQALTRPGEVLIDDPNRAWVQIIARRRPNASDEEMQAEMAVIAQASLADHSTRRANVSVEPGAFLNFPKIKSAAAPIVTILFLAVSLVLIVACANVANMLLARGLARRREIAIRLSMGAGRGRLLQQLLTESVLLALIGGAGGLLLAEIAGHVLIASLPTGQIGPHQLDLSPDRNVLLFTLLVASLTGVIFGLLPALNTLRLDLSPALKTSGLQDAARPRRQWLQNTLIAVQVAVCLVLLVNAGLLLRAVQRAFSMDTGQATRNVLIASFDLRQQQYTAADAHRFINTLRENMNLVPGVQGVSVTSVRPLFDQCGSVASLVGRDGNSGSSFKTSCNEVGPDYFQTMKIPILFGREFTRADAAGDEKLAIVDESIARTKFEGHNPVGERIRIGGYDGDYRIVGVAAPVRLLDATNRGLPQVYTVMRGLRNTEAKMVIRYAGSIETVIKSLQHATGALDGNVSVSTERIEENAMQAVAPVRIAASATSALGTVGMVLACTGVYGVIAFAVRRRRREVGIRMALGASRARVLRLVLWQGLKPVAAGIVVGLGLAAWGAVLIRAILYGVSPFDPIAFGATALLLAGVALLAACLPARDAIRVDPAITLRYD